MSEQIAKKGNIDLKTSGPPQPVPLLLSQPERASDATDPSARTHDTSSPDILEHILQQVNEIWIKQETQKEELVTWAQNCSKATRVLQCQTVDAVFLNGVSALLTVYKAHAALYEILKIPQKKATESIATLIRLMDTKFRNMTLIRKRDGGMGWWTPCSLKREKLTLTRRQRGFRFSPCSSSVTVDIRVLSSA